MDAKGPQLIIDDICDYCERKRIKDLLQEYMKRLVLEKPQDPIGFLIKTIDENPFEYAPETEAKWFMFDVNSCIVLMTMFVSVAIISYFLSFPYTVVAH